MTAPSNEPRNFVLSLGPIPKDLQWKIRDRFRVDYYRRCGRAYQVIFIGGHDDRLMADTIKRLRAAGHDCPIAAIVYDDWSLSQIRAADVDHIVDGRTFNADDLLLNLQRKRLGPENTVTAETTNILGGFGEAKAWLLVSNGRQQFVYNPRTQIILGSEGRQRLGDSANRVLLAFIQTRKILSHREIMNRRFFSPGDAAVRICRLRRVINTVVGEMSDGPATSFIEAVRGGSYGLRTNVIVRELSAGEYQTHVHSGLKIAAKNGSRPDSDHVDGSQRPLAHAAKPLGPPAEHP